MVIARYLLTLAISFSLPVAAGLFSVAAFATDQQEGQAETTQNIVTLYEQRLEDTTTDPGFTGSHSRSFQAAAVHPGRVLVRFSENTTRLAKQVGL
ncbi:MAG: hypothetical protein JSU63_06385, partial [Phycisphaerales bacterium]